MIIRIVTFILMYVVSMNTAISQFDESLCFEYYKKYTSSFTAVEDYHEKALTHAHLSKSSGVYHMYFQQKLNGLDAIGGVLSLHVGKDGKLLKSHDRFYKDMKENHLPSLNLLSLEKVVASAWSLHGYNNVKNWYVDTIYQRPDQLTFVETGDYFYGKTSGRLVYVYTSDKLLTPSWEIKFENISGSEAWIVYIDAKTGTHLMSYNQVISCQYDHTKEPDSGFKKAFLPIATDTLPEYNVYPLKIESPNHGPRNLMIFSNDSLASPYDWHDVDGLPGHDFTTTKGNNVEAREDKDGVNNTPGQMADGGEDLNFDFTKLTGVHPHTNQNASITNLFFLE